MSTLTEIKDILAPVKTRKDASLGTNIMPRNPDVEVLAMTLRPLPVTMDKFNDLSSGKGWCSSAIMVLDVGPPGFSSVPYTSTKKKGDKEVNSESLYETTDDGVCLYSFQKGRTNKDRGKRAEEWLDPNASESADTPPAKVPVKHVLKAGESFSFFLGDGDYAAGKDFVTACDDLGMLPAGTFVYVQVGVKNVDQASQGRLLKIKRVKMIAEPGAVIANILGNFPSSVSEFKQVQQRVSASPAVAKQSYQGTTSVYADTLDKEAYAVWEDDKQSFVIINFDTEHDLQVPLKIAQAGCSMLDTTRIVRLLNVAIASGAVQAVVSTSVHKGVSMDTDINSTGYDCLFLNVNTNNLLKLDAIADLNDLDTGTVAQGVRVTAWQDEDKKKVLWSDPAVQIMAHDNMLYNVYFCLDMNASVLEDGWNSTHAGFLSDGCSGSFYALRIYLTQRSLSLEQVQGGVQNTSSGVMHVIDLQIRPQDRMQSSDSRKRKRCDITAAIDCPYGEAVSV